MENHFDERRFESLSRRELLKLTPLLLAGAFIVPRLRTPLLRSGVGFSDWAAGRFFRRGHAAPTYSDSKLTPLERFPLNSYDTTDPGVDLETWTLRVSGLVQKPGEYTLAQIQALPLVRQNTRHCCVEGWDVIGSFGGARLADFLSLVGADPKARYLEVECADDYYESIDMASAVHPQSLLCHEMYGQPLTGGHGAPLRLSIPTKLGYKQAKWLTTLQVSNVLRPDRHGYWEDQGYAWYAGL